MDPLTDFDRALREAMRVEPGGDFSARIRVRITESRRPMPIPRLALATSVCAVLVLTAVGLWRESERTAVQSLLAHRDLLVFVEPPRVVSSPRSSHALGSFD